MHILNQQIFVSWGITIVKLNNSKQHSFIIILRQNPAPPIKCSHDASAHWYIWHGTLVNGWVDLVNGLSLDHCGPLMLTSLLHHPPPSTDATTRLLLGWTRFAFHLGRLPACGGVRRRSGPWVVFGVMMNVLLGVVAMMMMMIMMGFLVRRVDRRGSTRWCLIQKSLHSTQIAHLYRVKMQVHVCVYVCQVHAKIYATASENLELATSSTFSHNKFETLKNDQRSKLLNK